jgi:5-methylcytosine-specific restriction protein A
MGKPDWTRDELILALDLYFREPAARGSKTHPGVIELSSVLNRLPIHSKSELEEDFRNPNGVGMKLSNFLRFDPSYTGAGLKRGSHLEEDVWNAFALDPVRLKETAAAIRATLKTGEIVSGEDIDIDETEAPVTVRKDDALAANQAALAKVADRGTFSSCGGLIHITSG